MNKKYFNDLFKFDKNRLYEILAMIQYTIMYIILSMIFAHLIDVIFFDPYIDISDKKLSTLFVDVVLQIILCVIAVFYIRKIVRIFPFLLNSKYKIPNYNDEIVISFIFIASQQNLLKKINYIISQADKNFFD